MRGKGEWRMSKWGLALWVVLAGALTSLGGWTLDGRPRAVFVENDPAWAAASNRVSYVGHTQSASSITNAPWVTDAVWADRLCVNLISPLVYDAEGRNLHFDVQWSTNGAFSPVTSYCTTNDQTGWSYWNGSQFAGFPAGGMSSNYYGVDVPACVVFAPTNVLTGPMYIRARAFDGDDWGDYYAGYGAGVVYVGK